MTKRLKKTTNTTLVLEALIRADDFLTSKMLSDSIGITPGSVNVAVHSLQSFKAVECVEGNGKLWWFATPENDTRTKHIHERTPESRPRRPKKTKLAPMPNIQVGSAKPPLEQMRDLEKIAKEFKNG